MIEIESSLTEVQNLNLGQKSILESCWGELARLKVKKVPKHLTHT